MSEEEHVYKKPKMRLCLHHIKLTAVLRLLKHIVTIVVKYIFVFIYKHVEFFIYMGSEK